jgi:hypothetical protein
MAKSKDRFVLEGHVHLTCAKEGKHTEGSADRVVLGFAEHALEIKVCDFCLEGPKQPAATPSKVRPAVFSIGEDE